MIGPRMAFVAATKPSCIASGTSTAAVDLAQKALGANIGREVSGYEVANLADTVSKAKAAGATVLVDPYTANGRQAAILLFPGNYIAERPTSVCFGEANLGIFRIRKATGWTHAVTNRNNAVNFGVHPSSNQNYLLSRSDAFADLRDRRVRGSQ